MVIFLIPVFDKRYDWNKYYEQFISEDFGKEILDAKMTNASFEDHFWHLACLSVYYKKENDAYLEKMCLRKLCDLNYAYSAMIYFHKYEVLPKRFLQYLTSFENNMVDDKLEARIQYYNKVDKKKNLKKYALYASTSLICIPLMLFLVFVCKLDTTISMLISIGSIFAIDFIFI